MEAPITSRRQEVRPPEARLGESDELRRPFIDRKVLCDVARGMPPDQGKRRFASPLDDARVSIAGRIVVRRDRFTQGGFDKSPGCEARPKFALESGQGVVHFKSLGHPRVAKQ